MRRKDLIFREILALLIRNVHKNAKLTAYQNFRISAAMSHFRELLQGGLLKKGENGDSNFRNNPTNTRGIEYVVFLITIISA